MNRRIEKIANTIENVYDEIEKKILNCSENEKNKAIYIFLLKLLRPISININNENYEIEKRLRAIGYMIDKDLDGDGTITICHPHYLGWKWGPNDREAAQTILNVSDDVKDKYIKGMMKFVNAVFIENENKNVHKISERKLQERIDTVLNLNYDDLKKYYVQGYIETIDITKIEQIRKTIFQQDLETFKKFAPDLAIIAALQKQRRRKKQKKAAR